MPFKVEDVSSVKKTLHIEIPQDEVARELDKAYNQLKKSAKVKGFRPGKVPRSVLERMFKRDVHADVSRRAGHDGANGETDCGAGPERYPEHDAEHHPDDADGGVLAVQVGLGAFLNGAGDLFHALVAFRLGEDPFHRHEPVDQRQRGAAQGRARGEGAWHRDAQLERALEHLEARIRARVDAMIEALGDAVRCGAPETLQLGEDLLLRYTFTHTTESP